MALSFVDAPAYADDAHATSAVQASATPAASAAEPSADATREADQEVQRLQLATEQLRALIAGELTEPVDPLSLLTVAPSDDDAVPLEAAQLRTLVEAYDRAMRALETVPARGKKAPDPGVDEATLQLWQSPGYRARIELQRQQLAFYSQPRAQREQLLTEHEAKRQAALERETEAERRARVAEQERKAAQEAIRAARTEAERVVSSERARLLDLERDALALHERLTAQRAELEVRRAEWLVWKRRVREVEAGESADELYGALENALTEARAGLSAALSAAESDATEVPEIGPDPLQTLAIDVSIEAAATKRQELIGLLGDLRELERAERSERAATWLDGMGTLNRERLQLLEEVSPGMRDTLLGFTATGLQTARDELAHLVLVLRYHQHAARTWLGQLELTDRPTARTALRALGLLLPFAVVLACFFWWRKRSPLWLLWLDRRMRESERAERRSQATPARQALTVLRAIHRPLEHGVLYGALLQLLPSTASNLLEVQLLSVVIGWSIGGSLVVNTLNAIASLRRPHQAGAQVELDTLRLRSLQLIGRMVVALVVALVLSERLVGEGTIYDWVLWLRVPVAVWVALRLGGWWREAIFSRLDRPRKKSAWQAWMLRHRSGWRSYVLAVLGGTYLLLRNGARAVWLQLLNFNLVRRALAYLFRRELDRLENDAHGALAPLGNELYAALGPHGKQVPLVQEALTSPLAQITARIEQRRGGVVALLGARGMGKSTLLGQLNQLHDGVVRVDCTTLPLHHGWCQRLTDHAATADVMLFDDLQVLVRTTVGGMQRFDELLRTARNSSRRTVWVLAIDETVWPYVQRAAEGQPLFDEVVRLTPWSEEQIGELLFARSEAVGVEPSFEGLLDPLAARGDELDRQEALETKRDGYYRMLWDHVRGNPGIALHVWRNSLSRHEDGTVAVRPLQVPSEEELEQLPDSALFVLRATLQLAPATAADVVEATRLPESLVHGALRYAADHGYVTEHDQRYEVTWTWLRAILRILEVRHLLVMR